MPRVRRNISFNQETFQALMAYIREKHGEAKVVSITVDRAVREYLDREQPMSTCPNIQN